MVLAFCKTGNCLTIKEKNCQKLFDKLTWNWTNNSAECKECLLQGMPRCQ